MSRLGSIPRPTNDEIDIKGSDGLDQDIATNYRDDSGTHRRYITWWGRTYPGAIFLADFPGGNLRLWRQSGDEDGSDTSEEGLDDHADDTREPEVGEDKDDSNIREGDQDGTDEEDGEEEDDDEEDEDIQEEDESDVVPYHPKEDTIVLDPLSLPLQAENDPNPSPARPTPTIQRQYEHEEPSGSQSQAVTFHDPYW